MIDINKKKSSGKGCGASILGTLFVVLGVIVFAILSSLLARVFVGARFADEVGCALLTFSLTAVFIAFVLYEAIFIVWQLKISAASANNKETETKMKKLLKIVAIAAISLSLLVAVFSANTYTECRESSISKVCFVPVKEYRWDEERNDVRNYRLSCASGGALTFNITMKDGEVIELFGPVTSVSGKFSEKYETSRLNLVGYAYSLSEQFDTSGYYIEKKISGYEYMESFYKEAYPEIWEYLSLIAE